MLKARTETSQVFSVLQSLQDKALPDGAEAAAAKSFHSDVLQWILSGRAFERRSGKLQDSIVYKLLNDSADLVSVGDGKAFYARFVENRKPFMLIDMENRKRNMNNAVSKFIADFIK